MHSTVRILCLVAGLHTGTALAQSCVSSSPTTTPLSDFTISGDSATHNATGLTWKRCLVGQTFSDGGTPDVYTDDTCTPGLTSLQWEYALQLSELTPGWRLPNAKELAALVEYSCSSPAFNTTVFPGLGSVNLWTSSPVAGQPTQAWVLYTGDGHLLANNRANYLYIRLVSQ